MDRTALLQTLRDVYGEEPEAYISSKLGAPEGALTDAQVECFYAQFVCACPTLQRAYNRRVVATPKQIQAQLQELVIVRSAVQQQALERLRAMREKNANKQ